MISYMISYMMSHMISCYTQYCVVLLAPYPNNPNPVDSFNVTTDFDLQGDDLVWYAPSAAASPCKTTRHTFLVISFEKLYYVLNYNFKL